MKQQLPVVVVVIPLGRNVGRAHTTAVGTAKTSPFLGGKRPLDPGRHKQGTEAQNRAWVDLADRQLAELKRQQDDLADAIADLAALREEVAKSL